MILPAFEEKHEAYNPVGYPVTNEEPETIRRMLKGRHFKKAGGICGGGEVSVFTLLPFCEELYCVDHAYRPIVTLYTKLALLQKLGVNGLRKVLENDSEWDFYEHARAIVKELPAPLQPKAKWPEGKKRSYVYESYSLGTSDYQYMRKEWNLFSDAVLKRAVARLDRVRILHGDLKNDLPTYGKFDLLYISNAHEHINRESCTLKVADLALTLLTDKGLLLMAGSYDSRSTPYPGLKKVKAIKGFRSSWTYSLYQKAKPRVKKATANATA